MLSGQLKAIRARSGLQDMISISAQGQAKHGAHLQIIIDKQNRFHEEGYF
jgi:hypothetical protein